MTLSSAAITWFDGNADGNAWEQQEGEIKSFVV